MPCDAVTDAAPAQVPEAPLPVSDRAMLNAIFELLGALATRLTGQVPHVRIPFTDGGDCSFYPSGDHVVLWKGPTLRDHLRQNRLKFIAEDEALLPAVREGVRVALAAVKKFDEGP